MTSLRRLLAPLTVLCLMSQVGGVVLGAGANWVASIEDALECTCSHGDHAMCPMHHRPAGTSRCSMRAAHDADATALASLLGGIGILHARMAVASHDAVRVPLSRRDESVSRRSAPPDSPPPRP